MRASRRCTFRPLSAATHASGAKIRSAVSGRGDGLLLLLVSLLASSCAVQPKPMAVAPPVEIPAAFRANGERPRTERWWRELETPELDRLMELALVNNRDLHAAWARLDQARAVARKAGAPLRPRLSLESSAARSWRETDSAAPPGGGALPGGGTLGGGGGKSAINAFDLALTTSYEIDLWGRIRQARAAATLEAEAGGLDLQAAALSITASVARTWVRLVRLREQEKLLHAQAGVNETFLRLTELRFEQGQGSAVDVLQQRQQLEATRGELPANRMEQALAQHQLALLLGRPAQAPPQTERARVPSVPPLPQTGVPLELLMRRPDVEAARRRLAAADRRVASAVADRFPALRLGGRGAAEADRLADLFENWLASLAANLTAPLFDGGLRAAEVERSRAAARERLAAYGKTALVALREVADALEKERRIRETLQSIRSQIANAEETVKRTRMRYMHGATAYLPVLTALVTLQRLQGREVETRARLVEARIDLAVSLAGGWTPPRAPTAEVMSSAKGERR